MRPFPFLLAGAALVLLAACSTPDTRIADHRAEFDKFPAEVQQKIRAGQVDVGFTPEMVRLALGEPDRVFSHQSATDASELWVYRDNRPRFSFGLGIGSAGGHSATSLGVAGSSGGRGPDEKVRVEFRQGRVTAVDYAKR